MVAVAVRTRRNMQIVVLIGDEHSHMWRIDHELCRFPHLGSEQATLRAGEPANLGERLGTK
jgi:hypothetical protein